MLKYKIKVADALKRKGFNTYKAKTTKILSQDTLKKIKNEDTNISLESLNRICILLDMQPKDLIEYVETEAEKEKFKISLNITWQSYINGLILEVSRTTWFYKASLLDKKSCIIILFQRKERLKGEHYESGKENKQ